VKRVTVGVTALTMWALVLVAAAGAQGQEGPASGGQTPTITFRSGVEAVTVTATVRDGRGRVVKNLKKSDFEVFDGGSVRQIQDFHAGDTAVSLAVLLDISGSMSVGGNMVRAREAVNVALGNLQGGRDEASLFTFDTELQEVRAFTTRLERITSVSLEGKPWGMTSLYDAIGATARRVAERTNRHRAVLVITDGVDTGSRMTPPQVSYVASSIDVPVYLLVVSNPVDNPGHELAVLAATGDTPPNTATLADLARWTGGEMAISSELEDSTKALRELMGNLRHQYLISFEPGARPGWHPLEIRTRKKNLTVHARSGYLAGSARTGS
jgi:Ca-activated chloride channel family protein